MQILCVDGITDTAYSSKLMLAYQLNQRLGGDSQGQITHVCVEQEML